MSKLYGVDVSEWQGTIDWDALNANSNFVIIRSSFGTARRDLQFNRNQSEARRVRDQAGPLGIGYYYYAYPAQIGAIESADFFTGNLGTLQEGEVLVLDLEGNVGPDPVGWSLAWLNRVYITTTVRPLVYLNQSLRDSYDWSPVVNGDYGLWLAVYDNNKESLPAAGHWPFVAIKQWTNVDHVPGISNQVDGDTFFGDFNTWNAYGYKSPAAPPPPQPTPPPPPPPPTPTPPPTTVPPTETPPVVVPPVVVPAPDPLPVSPPPPSVEPPPVVTPGPSSAPSVPFWSTTIGRLLIGTAVTALTPLVMSLKNFHTNDLGLTTFILAAVTILVGIKDFLNVQLNNTPNSKR